MSTVLFDITARRAASAPDRPAMEDRGTGRRVTYGTLDERAARAGALLTARGVGPGDRVAILCRNRIEFFELLFACAKTGAILVPLNWRMPPAELAGLMADCAPALLIYGHEDAGTAQVLSGPKLALDDPGAEGYEAGVSAHAPLAPRDHWPLDEIWYLLYTSGTTGQPKGVIQTFGMAFFNYVNTRQAIDIRQDDVTLNFLPLFHTAGINLFTLPTLFAGGRVIVFPGFEPGPVMDLLSAGTIDTFFAVPAVYQALSLDPRFGRTDLSRVRGWGCGGAPLTDALVETFAARGAMVCNGYGMTETGPTTLFMDPAKVAAKIGSVGRPQFQVAVRIVGPEGQDVPIGAVGEIWVAGPAITPGYWNRPDTTAESFAPGGWLKTGDLGRCDGDGYYWVIGRIKEMYISGGENVYPAEVENVLADHPDVLEAAVVGVPDDRWGEVGHAYVLPRPGAHPNMAVLADFCRERLAAYKIPRRFFIMTQDFPRTASGKVQKHLLSADDTVQE